MSGTKIAKCTCFHPYQDSLYGKGFRVFNLKDQKKSPGQGSCTSCGYDKTVGKSEDIPKKKKKQKTESSS